MQALVTDTPFGQDFFNRLDDLLGFTERDLAEGGGIAIHTGEVILPRLLDAMGKHLDGRWMFVSHYGIERGFAHEWNDERSQLT